VTSYPSLSRNYTKDLLQFYHTQRQAKLRLLKMVKNKEEGLGLPVSATQEENLQFSVACSAEVSSSLHN